VWRLSRIGVLALLLSGVKLLPVLMVGDPGMWRGAEGFCFTPAGLATGLTSWVIPGSQFEGCGYVGAGVLGLGVLGFVLHARRFAGLLFCTILLAAYALGTHLLPGAWQGPTGMHECPPGFSFSRLVRELPFFDALWNPSRALVPVGLLLSVAAAGALDSLAEATAQRFGGREPGRLRVALCLSLTLAVCVPAYAQVSAYLGHTMTPLDLGEPPAERSPFRQHAECATPDDRAAVRKSDVFCPRLNRGSRLSNLAFHPTAPGLRVVEDPAYLGEQYWLPEAGGAGQVTRTDWTPNHMTYHVEGTGSGWLVINQNYRRGWTVDGLDTSVVSIQGLMAVQLSAPATVTLRYQPSAFSYGLAVTLLGWILLVLWWRAGPRRRGGRPRTLPV
jgi:hypothetical protein